MPACGTIRTGDRPVALREWHGCCCLYRNRRPFNRDPETIAMTIENWVGWIASAILLFTLNSQVRTQWKERSAQGVSAGLFAGQIAASIGFVTYSILVADRVFVFTNLAILTASLVGQAIYLRNAKRDDTKCHGRQE
jgi:uncharacterized protein with PQ loop repeat